MASTPTSSHHSQHRSSSSSKKRKRPPYFKNKDKNKRKHVHSASSSSSVHDVSFSRTVDPETAHYFNEISSLLEKSSTDAEERAILCSNALEESRGKELQLMCDKVFSRLFENLLLSCETSRLCDFLMRTWKVFPAMAVDPAGSHVAEAAMKALVLAIQESDNNQAIYDNVEEVLTKLCEVLSKSSVEVVCNQHGSHVLRSLLSLCCGTLLQSSDKSHSKPSLLDRIKMLAPDNHVKMARDVPSPAFPHLLHSAVQNLLNCIKDNIEIVRKDKLGSLVLQTMLKVLVKDEAEVTNVIVMLMNCSTVNIGKVGKMLEEAVTENVLDLIMDPTGSHLMEVILEVAPDILFVEIFNRFFRHFLFQIAMDEYGNFALQSLISHSKQQEQINIIWKEIGCKFPELLNAGKLGVLATLMSACYQFQTNQHECCRLLAHAVSSESATSNCLVPRILQLGRSSCVEKSDLQFPSGSKISLFGSVMLQIIFNYPSEIVQKYSSSFISMSNEQILEVARDPGGSRVIEAFLTSKVSSKQKFRIISKLQGYFGELAQELYGSFTVLKCFLAADLSLKEVIASELANVQNELSRLKHGLHLLRVCDVDRYVKGPAEWRSCQSSKESARESFTKIFGLEYENDKNARDSVGKNRKCPTFLSDKSKKAYKGNSRGGKKHKG